MIIFIFLLHFSKNRALIRKIWTSEIFKTEQYIIDFCKSDYFLLLQLEAGFHVFKVNDKEVDFHMSLFHQATFETYETAQIRPMKHDKNNSIKEFWLIFLNHEITIFSINISKNLIKINPLFKIQLRIDFKCLISVHEQTFIGIIDNTNIQAFTVSKNSLIFYKPQELEISIQGQIQKHKNQHFENLSTALFLNKNNLAYLSNHRATPEIIAVSKNSVYLFRFKTQFDFVNSYFLDLEFLKAFSFIDEILKDRINLVTFLDKGKEGKKDLVDLLVERIVH